MNEETETRFLFLNLNKWHRMLFTVPLLFVVFQRPFRATMSVFFVYKAPFFIQKT